MNTCNYNVVKCYITTWMCTRPTFYLLTIGLLFLHKGVLIHWFTDRVRRYVNLFFMLYLVLPLKFYCKARVGQCTRAWPTMSVLRSAWQRPWRIITQVQGFLVRSSTQQVAQSLRYCWRTRVTHCIAANGKVLKQSRDHNHANLGGDMSSFW